MRVSIEDEGISQAEILGIQLGLTHAEVIGRLVLLWSTTQKAQVFELPGDAILRLFQVKQELEAKALNLLESAGFISRKSEQNSASKTNIFVIRGNKKHIKALQSYRDRARSGGLKSGEARRKTKENQSVEGKKQSKHQLREKTKHQLPASFEAPASPQLREKTKPILSYTTLSYSNSILEESKKTSPRGGELESSPPRSELVDQKNKTQKFIAAYIRAYQSRFKDGRPEDLSDGKVRGQIKLFAEQHPDIDRACQLIQVYFQMRTQWFETKGYDFLTFKNNLAVIGQALDSGIEATGNAGYWDAFLKRYANEEKNDGA